MSEPTKHISEVVPEILEELKGHLNKSQEELYENAATLLAREWKDRDLQQRETDLIQILMKCAEPGYPGDSRKKIKEILWHGVVISPHQFDAAILEYGKPAESFTEVADLISDKVRLIDSWYADWQGEKWLEMKKTRPKDCEKIHKALDNINEIYAQFRKEKSTKQDIEKAIDAYAEVWRKVPTHFPR